MIKKGLLFLIFFVLTSCMFFREPQKLLPGSFTKDNGNTWTIMVYMNGDNSLSDYTVLDINEMEKGIYDGVNIIVLQDRKNMGARILKIKKDENIYFINSVELTASINGKNFAPGVYPEIDMLDKNNLSGFIDYCKLNFPSDKYALIIWSHSDGWRSYKGINSDEDSGSNLMKNSDIASVVAPRGISVVAFDSCLQGTLENIWEFKKAGYNGFLIASPNNVPGTGWDYNDFLERLENSYKREFDFAYSAIISYSNTYKNYPYGRVSLSAYYLPYFDTESFKAFFTYLKNNANSSGFFNDSLHSYWDTYEVWPLGKHIDFYTSLLNSNYPYKNLLASVISRFIVYSWDSVKGNSYSGFSIVDAKGTGYYATYKIINLAVDTDWDNALDARSW